LFHEWRVVTARILALRNPGDAEPHILEAVKGKVHHVNNALGNIVRGRLDQETLIDIFMAAVNLDAQMHQQRSHFVLHPVLENLQFSQDLRFVKSEMEAMDEYNYVSQDFKRQVRLVRRPGLWKFGNSAGKDYQTLICILPTVVDLEPPRQIRFWGSAP